MGSASAEPFRRDITFWYGADFERTYTFYNDTRLKRWRGTWQEWRVYGKGEGVEWEGDAWVSTLGENRHVEPGASGNFWSKMERRDLTGATVQFYVEGVLEPFVPSVNAEEGEVVLAIGHSRFSSAPASAPYYFKFTSPSGGISYPQLGTALFRKP